MGQEVVLCSGKKMGVFNKGRCDRERETLTTESRQLWGRPPSSVKAGSQDSTKDIINNTHESEWPQVNHFSFFQPLHFEAAPSRSRTSCHTKGLCGQFLGIFSCAEHQHFPRLFPLSKSD